MDGRKAKLPHRGLRQRHTWKTKLFPGDTLAKQADTFRGT